jgi:hypothetical protein
MDFPESTFAIAIVGIFVIRFDTKMATAAARFFAPGVKWPCHKRKEQKLPKIQRKGPDFVGDDASAKTPPQVAMGEKILKTGKKTRPKSAFKGKRFRCASCHRRSPKPVKTPAPWYCSTCARQRNLSGSPDQNQH